MTTSHLSTARQSGSLWNLGGLTLSQLSRRVLDEVVANNVVGHAAELAFFFLFALFPLILRSGGATAGGEAHSFGNDPGHGDDAVLVEDLWEGLFGRFPVKP